MKANTFTKGGCSSCIIILLLILSSVLAGSVDQDRNKFFAFDNGIGRGKLTPQEQAEILKELDFDGIGYTGITNLSERIKVFRKHNIFACS